MDGHRSRVPGPSGRAREDDIPMRAAAVNVVLVGLLWTAAVVSGAAQFRADPPKVCGSCAAWNADQQPFRVFGNTYYVGVAGLSAVLIASDAGHVLLDAGLPQSAPSIDAHIRALGFKTEDVKLIVNSHAHFDHAGGINALQRASGAQVAASASSAPVLRAGGPGPDDPQYGFGRESMAFPPVARVRIVKDGDVLRVGPIAITAHLTPGHTPGSTTWTWKSCEGARCLDVVYADSLNAVSAPGFRFSGDPSHPGRVADFRKSIATVAALPCDILLSVHPEFSGMAGKLQRRSAGATENPFVDPAGCRAYAATASEALGRRLTEER
jgi:metallo-beta-lactamase class B